MSIRRSLIVAAGLLMTCGLGACGAGERGDEAASTAASAPMESAKAVLASRAASGAAADKAEAPKPELTSLVAQRSIIRKAQISIRVDQVEKAEKQVDSAIVGMGGYVDSAQSADLASEHPTIDLTLRVPVAQFDNALAKFEALGVRLSKTVSSEDVTGQLVDLDARLRTMSAQEETYRGLLRRATALQSVIALQDKLTQVRSEIESMAAQRKNLGGLAALSTIEVHLEQSAIPIRPSADPGWLAQVWGESTSSLSGLARMLATALIWLAVFCPIWLPLVLLGRRAYRQYTAQRAAPQPVPPPYLG